MCHALLHDPKFLALLLRIDHDLAASTRADGCRCGGVLHRADYPRKPRGCPIEVRDDHCSRLSFCCSVCRRRATSRSVRFLARRVYFALAVVLAHAGAGRPVAFMLALGGVWGMGLHMGAQMRRLDLDDPASCMTVFRSNRDAGLIPVPFLAVAAWLG